MTAADRPPASPPQLTPARQAAYGGILGAAVLFSLLAATTLPTNRIFFHGLSSVFIAVVVMEFGLRSGFLFYLATSLLALLFLPNKAGLLPYLLVLGHYGLWKTIIEGLEKPWLEILLKMLVLSLGTLVAWFLARYLFFSQLQLPFSLWLVLPLLASLFLVYDYAFTLWVRFYHQRLRPHLDR